MGNMDGPSTPFIGPNARSGLISAISETDVKSQALPCSEVSVSPSRKILPAEQEVLDLCKELFGGNYLEVAEPLSYYSGRRESFLEPADYALVSVSQQGLTSSSAGIVTVRETEAREKHDYLMPRSCVVAELEQGPKALWLPRH